MLPVDLKDLFWFLLICGWWITAMTIFIPISLLLYFSAKARHIWFSWFFSTLVGPIFNRQSRTQREKAFAILKDNIKNRNKDIPLEVLEIGVGAGPNLKYYPENCNLTVLDFNAYFEAYFNKNTKKFAHINYQRTVIQPAEDMKGIADGSMDIVVSTYLHCSCRSTEDVLKEVKRVLKPGGKYVFLEHVDFPKDTLGLISQRLVNPLWTRFMNGCTLDRDTGSKIRAAGFADVQMENLKGYEWFTYLVSQQIVGVATP